ncbi:MAG: DNA polymerase III subunit delta' [Burkholderiales bacterium]
MNIYPWHEAFWLDLLKQQRDWPNALLLKGRKGIGKQVFGLALAQYLLCETPAGQACGKCPGCLWFMSGNHPDFRLIEPAVLSEADAEIEEKKKEKAQSHQISIEQVRELDDFINLTSHRNGYKVILIHPAEAMNPHAANALLKTLEEPPGKTIFILVTHKPQRLALTIISRCRAVALPAPSRDAGLRWLQEQGIQDAESALSQTGDAPLGALAANSSEYQRRQFLEQISTAQLNPLAVAENVLHYPLEDVVNWLQKWVCDIAYFKFAGKIRYHLDYAKKLQRLAEKTGAMGLMHYYRELLAAQRAVQHPLNPRLVLEQLALSYCHLVLKNE